MSSLITFLLFCFGGCTAAAQVFQSDGDLNLVLILENCKETQPQFVRQSLINSAIWTVKRLNFLQFINESLSFGLKVVETCGEKDDLEAVFNIYQSGEQEVVIGVVTGKQFGYKTRKMAQVLDIQITETSKGLSKLIKASVELLAVLNWKDNLTVVAPERLSLVEFTELSKEYKICVVNYFVYDLLPLSLRNFTGNLMVFGNRIELDSFLQSEEEKTDRNFVFVPLDGAILTDLPPNSFAIIPPHIPLVHNFKKSSFFATPLLFQVAIPLVTIAENLRGFLLENCNETNYKLNCLRTVPFRNQDLFLTADQILQLLKIEPLLPNFVYNIFKNDNLSTNYAKIMQFNYFWNNLTILDSNYNLSSDESSCNSDCLNKCKNFDLVRAGLNNGWGEIRLRNESWVFIFLSISLLGVLLCFSVLVFLLVAIFRRDILEGNPLMSILLLLAVVCIFSAVIPVVLEADNAKETICVWRALGTTLSLAAAFSLLLSRSILLATAQKDTGFMAHLAGPVQSFLCLFIFGVQAALSLQVFGRCSEVFRGFSFIYLLSYNAMLVLLLLCLTPLIYKCQRNYREGKYFSIAIGLIAVLWIAWLTLYVFVSDDLRDWVLCFGLVSTGTVLMGAIFVPRTYLMTIAAARDKITSGLPSLATSTSIMDIYRSGTQPVYDCVNVAAINAVNVARAGVTTIQPEDLYTCPPFQSNDDEDYELRCDSPVSNDKVTRF